MAGNALIVVGRVQRTILRIRGANVILDADLALFYGVETKTLVRAMRRNRARFPGDFMFQLTRAEFANLRSQFGTSSLWGGRRYRPYAFTEQGVAMLSGLLKSPRAVHMNVAIMRAFVRVRELLESHAGLTRRLDQLERRYDGRFKVVFDAIRTLMTPPAEPRRKIGFRT